MKPNRLAKESSPYLLQHATNPVDWYPWGDDALNAARREKKPIFLSIGYSACHWCHVMAHESFEDAETAKLLNRHFISIKVDREERPDIDHLYMGAVQALTGHGGWPLSVFLTPALEPFYGGTYFPPEDRHGLPAFRKLLGGISEAWVSRPDEVASNAKALTEALNELQKGGAELPPSESLSLDLVDAAVSAVRKSFDPVSGGLGTAPKFFHSIMFRLALRAWRRSDDADTLRLVTLTLDRIASGGVRDQLGGGFHRYSTDAEWLVPHFEKMLYDNALLPVLYFEAFQATQEPGYAEIGRNTLDYVLREMASPEGSFFSTQDADSEGEEGKFYVWSHPEVFAVLGNELGELFCRTYDISPEGNWDGKNIPRLKQKLEVVAKELGQKLSELEDQLSVAKRMLLQARSERVWPARDEKVLLSWNGLMLSALAAGYQSERDNRYLEAAEKAGTALLSQFTSPNPLPSGKRRLLHCRKDGTSRFNGYLDDYAFFLSGLISLYECSFKNEWIQSATEVADSLVEQFWEPKEQVFYFTGKDHEKLISRPKETQDGATPSGQAAAIYGLLRLARLLDRSDYEDIATAALSTFEPFMRLIPTGVGQLLIGLDFIEGTPLEMVVIEGDRPEDFERVMRELGRSYLPHCVIAGQRKNAEPSALALLKGRSALNGETTLYMCRKFTCETPVAGVENILNEIGKWIRA
jgi:uncharacterized protein